MGMGRDRGIACSNRPGTCSSQAMARRLGLRSAPSRRLTALAVIFMPLVVVVVVEPAFSHTVFSKKVTGCCVAAHFPPRALKLVVARQTSSQPFGHSTLSEKKSYGTRHESSCNETL